MNNSFEAIIIGQTPEQLTRVTYLASVPSQELPRHESSTALEIGGTVLAVTVLAGLTLRALIGGKQYVDREAQQQTTLAYCGRKSRRS